MPFIGKSPKAGNYILLDSITTSATATYNLTRNSTAYFPASARNLIVSLNGITQAPDTAYSVSGSTITFASALTSSDVIDYILVLGDVLSIGTPADNTVGESQLSYPLTNFSSTGIDDNATDKILTLSGSSTANNSLVTELGTNSTSGYYLESTSYGLEAYEAVNSLSTTLRLKAGGNTILSHNSVEDGIRLRTNDTNRLFIKSTGEVGIGTLSPDSLLHVYNDVDAEEQIIIAETFGDYSDGTGISFVLDQTEMGHVNAHKTRGMTFYVTPGSGSAAVERVRIDTSGNLCVGVTTPGSPGLSVATGKNIGFQQSNGESLANMFRQNTSGALVLSQGYQYSSTLNGWASSFSPSLSRTAVWLGNSIRFYADPAATVSVGTDITPTERVRIDTDGLKFNGDTAAANALDDYEEGTWTPVLTYGGGNTGQVMTSNVEGTYVKIGSLVTANIRWTQSTKGTSTGAVALSLPFAVDNTMSTTALEAQGSLGYYQNVTVTHSTLTVTAWNSSSTVQFYYRASDTSTNMTSLTDAHVGDGFDGRATVTYRTT